MKNLLPLIVMSIKLLIRGSFLLCLTLGPLMANTSKAQVKSIDEVFIKLDRKSYSLTRFFKETEKQTDFKFFYTDKALHVGQKIDLTKNHGNVEEFLIEIAKQTDLRFRQVNNAISVIIAPKENGQNLIQIELDPQNVDVQGTVTDADGEPIPGVTVSVQGTTTGTATDLEGRYTLSVPEGSTLVFSFIGFETQNIAVGDQSVINVTLNEDMSSLDEVVVVGYGTQKKINLTGSVKQLDGKELSSQSSIQTSAALMGKMSGVQVIQSSGQPGQNQGTIRIRGTGTLGNSNPLILIDGIPGELNNIPSTDIESITVLKDAAAAAVYGSRAANGVILVNTKRGTQEGIQVSYSGFLGWQQATNHPEFVDGATFMRLQNLGAENLGMSSIWSESYIQEWETNHVTDPDNYPSTDWVKEAFSESGLQQRHTLGVSGGSETIRLLGSLTYDEENSNIPNYGFKRYSIRLNTDIYATDQLDFNFDINLIRSEQTNPSQGIGRILTDIYRIPSVYVSRFSHGGWGPAFNLHNPIAYIHDGGISRNETTQARTRLGINYKFLESLNINIVYSPDFQLVNEKSAMKQYDITDPAGEIIQKIPGINSLSQDNSIHFTHNVNAVIKYEKSISDHALSILGGYEYITFKNSFFNAFRDQFQLQDFEQLDAGSVANQQNSGSEAEWALQSIFSRVNYNFRSKYLMEANLRYDGSSRFNQENRWGIFPSFSAGWVISEESFMEQLSVLNTLKIRGSWGILGNQQIGTYPFISTIDLGQNYIFGGNAVGGAAQLALANPGISWEQTTSTNLGFDVALLEDRLNFSVDFFNRKTSDILLQLPIPLIIGLTAPFQNAGEVKNSGWELEVGYRDMMGEDFSYEFSFNLSEVKNMVTNLRGAGPFISGNSITMEGAPIGAIFGYESNGFFNNQQEIDEHAEQPGQIAPGDIQYVDQNNDNIINADDRVIIGDPFPSLNYGLNLSAQFKGFDLTVFFQGIGRRDVYLSDYAAWPLYNGSNIRKWQAENYWRSDNMDASMPRFTPGSTHSNFAVSDFWVFDASYLRLRNFQIGYNLSSSSIERLPISSIRLFLMGENLFTSFDKMPQGVDPNVPNGSTYFPINKLLSVGMNINF